MNRMRRPLLRRADSGAVAGALPGGRLHFQHGPVDLVISAQGSREAVAAANDAAWDCFRPLLGDLVQELGSLRRQARAEIDYVDRFHGPVARRMAYAAGLFAGERFLTPMAAVAGAVADEVLAAMTSAAQLERAFVNNGGDIAFYLAPGRAVAAALADWRGRPLSRIRLEASDQVNGLATSGRHGRSLSMGVADSVTVVAADAAMADAAATLIANAVDLPGHPAVAREPAEAIDPDSDLGARLVVVDVGRLSPAEVDAALDAGVAEAERLCREAVIQGAALILRGAARVVGAVRLEARDSAGSARRRLERSARHGFGNSQDHGLGRGNAA